MRRAYLRVPNWMPERGRRTPLRRSKSRITSRARCSASSSARCCSSAPPSSACTSPSSQRQTRCALLCTLAIWSTSWAARPASTWKIYSFWVARLSSVIVSSRLFTGRIARMSSAIDKQFSMTANQLAIHNWVVCLAFNDRQTVVSTCWSPDWLTDFQYIILIARGGRVGDCQPVILSWIKTSVPN